MMIYCNLKGGLANMLFQIAATKSLSIDLNVDCSFPNLINQYHLLDADNYYNPRLKHSFEYQTIFSNLKFSPPDRPLPIIRYPFEFIKFNTPQDNFFIDGFFQTEKYFGKNKNNIIDYLKIPKDIEDYINLKYRHILNQRTTSIHIRRGDYIRFPNHHPILPLEYYSKAIDILKDKTDTFVIFSDDIEWCKEYFIKLDNSIYIENEKDYIEIYLMSLCKNNIIANSSFSLWCAILNENIDKIVVAPNIWFGNAISFNTIDVIHNNWIKI